MKLLAVVVFLASIVFGCGPSSIDGQPADPKKPCTKSAAKLSTSLHKVRSATFSAAISIRQEDQTHVVVVDLVDGSVCSLGTWATANVEDVHVDEDRTMLVVDAAATYIVREGVTSKGPRQGVYRVLFARRGTETRIIAWIARYAPSKLGDSLLDLTEPDQPRQIALFEGSLSLLGQLDDGRLLVSGEVKNATLQLHAVSFDGTVTTLLTVSPTSGALELHRTPRQEVTVRGPTQELGFYDVVTVDLATGTQTKTGKIPIVAPENHGYQSPDDAFVARTTRELPNGLRITTPAGDEVLLMHVATGRGAISFSGWVRR